MKHQCIYKFYFILGILFSIPFFAFGQFDQEPEPKFDSITVENDTDIDSTFFYVFNHDGQSRRLHRNETDTLLNYWNYVPAMKDDKFYFSLGNTGSPAMNGFWQPGRKIGFDPGLHHLDVYRLTSDELPFFSTGRAYTKLHYTQAPQQTKSTTNALVGRAFNKKSGITVQYDRINDIGEYSHFRTRQTSAGAGVYFHPTKKSKVIFSYISNNFFLEENGGIQSDTFLSNPDYNDRSVVPVNLNTPQSNWKEREVRLTSIWNLGKVQDTTTNGVSLIYDGKYNRTNYLYYDASQNDFYKQYAVHPRGQRASIINAAFSNAVGISINYGKSSKSKFNGSLSGRLEHRRNKYELDGKNRLINNIILHGEYQQQLSPIVDLEGRIAFGISDQSGNYVLHGEANIRPTPFIRLTGFILSQKHDVTGIYTSFTTLNNEIYNVSYSATSYNTIGGQLAIAKLGLSAEIKNTITDNYVYFDESLTPKQIGSAVNILQAKIGLTRKIGTLYTENHLCFQSSDNDNIALPNYMSKHYIGFKYRLFKQRLAVDTGIRGIVLPGYNGYGYFPLLGVFYPVNKTVPFDYTVTPVLGFKVDNFHVYFLGENIQSAWDKDPRYYIDTYPLHNFRLRIGLKWFLRG